MSTLINRVIYCDNCNEIYPGNIYSSPAEQRTQAKEKGWYSEIDPADGKIYDMCPTCHNRMKQKEYTYNYFEE
jgi:hypothetical protein